MNRRSPTVEVRRLLGGRGARALLAVVSLACGLCVSPAAAAEAQAAPAASPLPENDPFADELNPFGTGKTPAPAAPARPVPQPSVPAPPEQPADRPAPDRPRPPRLPVPFPESEGPDTDSRDAGRGGRRMPGSDDRADPRDSFDRRPSGDAGTRFRRDLPFDGGDEGSGAGRQPTLAERRLAEAEKLEQQGELEEARDALREVVKLDPSLALGHLALGVLLRRLEDFRGAVDACTKGIEVDPQEPELYLRRGIAWFHMGLYGIALEDFEEAAGMSYEDPRPELWRGLTLIELDRPLEAINAYASAIRRDRTCMLAYLNRGLAYLSTDEPHKAEFDFNQAIRQKPKDVRGWFNRGVAQARQKRYLEAIESYETALAISPGYEPARRNLEAVKRLAATERQRRPR